MEANSLLRTIALVVCVLSGYTVKSEENIYISHYGKNVGTCGNSSHPCATLRYALSSHPNASHVYMNGSGPHGVYFNEAGLDYMLIQHDFWLAGLGLQPVVFMCPENSNYSKLFRFAGQPHHGRIDVMIENLSILNCHGSSWDHSAVMELSNAQLSIVNSQFSNNRMLLHHSQIADDNCSSIQLIIQNSVFHNDLESEGSRLYEPAILLAGCNEVHVSVTGSQFLAAPLQVKAEATTAVLLTDVSLSGTSLRGSSLDITLSPGNNSVTLHRCNVTGHVASRASPISISTDSTPDSSTVLLREVRFHNNRRVKTRGAALAVFARLTPRTPPQVHVTLIDCSFVNNSVDDLKVAGAVYISSVAGVRFIRCQFVSNNASEGGAIYLYSAADVHLDACQFQSNAACNQQVLGYASRGGALFAVSSQLEVLDSTFNENSAVYSGSAVFMTDAVSVSLIRCNFTEPSSAELVRGPANTILSVSAGLPQTSSAVIKLTHCVIECAVERRHLLLYIAGQTNVNNSSVTCKSDAMTLREVSQPTTDYQSGYELKQLAVWSEMPCAAGKCVMSGKTADQSIDLGQSHRHVDNSSDELVQSTTRDNYRYTVKSEIYISHYGKNVGTCGNSSHPCATLRYALSSHPNASHVYMNGSGPHGVYFNEAGPDYMLIQHDFWLTGLGLQPVVFMCPENSNYSKLFQFAGQPHYGRIHIIIENLSIRNCHGSSQDHSAVIELSNAQLRIVNSQFSNNRMLLHHSQIADDDCSSVKLIIDSSVFHDDLESEGSRLYEPAILLAGCNEVNVSVTSSQFLAAPLQVKAEVTTAVLLTDVSLSGTSLRGSSLDITLSPGNNSVILHRCNVTGHVASRTSPISISTDSTPDSSTVLLREVRFHDNHRVKTRGAALAVFARLTPRTPPEVHVKLIDCSFVNNSADDLKVAGAVYISSVAGVRFIRCQFVSNNASEGGAIYLYSAAAVRLDACQFQSNAARNEQVLGYASRGGALFAVSSQLEVLDSTFNENSAVYSGSAVFMTDAVSVSLIRCNFTEPSSADLVRGPANTILSVSAGLPQTSSAVIKLTHCVIECAVERKHLLLCIAGQTNVNNSSVTCKSDAMALREVSQPTADYRSGYKLEQLVVWSEMACPTGKYVASGKSADLTIDLGQSHQLVDNSSHHQCYDCPKHAFCDGRLVHPDFNYCSVPKSDGLVDVTLCPDRYCQPRRGHESTGGSDYCSEGRSGPLCTGCDANHTSSLHFSGHISCTSDDSSCIDYSGATVAIICFTLFYVIVLLMLLKLCVRQYYEQLSIRSDVQSGVVRLSDVTSSSADSPRVTGGHLTSTRSLIGCLYSLVFFYQLVPSVYPRLMTSSWSLDRVIQLVVSLFHLYPAALATGRGFCLNEMADESTSAEQRYFFTMSIYWSQLVVIAMFFAVLSAVFLVTRGPFTEQNIKMLVSYFLSAYLFCQIFANVPLLRAGLQSVHCVAYNGSSIVFADAMTSCYTSWQVFSVLYVIVCVVPLCLVIDSGAFVLSRGRVSVPGYLTISLLPVIGLVWIPIKNLIARRSDASTRDEFEVDETTPEGLRSVSTHSIVIVQSVVIKPFRSYFASPLIDVGWMTVIMVRNCVICLLSSLLEHQPAARSVVVAVLCVGFTLDHVVSRGYVMKTANRVDSAALVMLSLLSLASVYVSVVYEAGVSHWNPVVLDWLCRLLVSLPVVIIILFVIILIIRASVRRFYRCRRARPL